MEMGENDSTNDARLWSRRFRVADTGTADASTSFHLSLEEDQEGSMKRLMALLDGARKLGFTVLEWSVSEETGHIALVLRRP